MRHPLSPGWRQCAREVAGHESTGCTAVEKCVNCQGKHTSFSRSCPKWKQEKEVVATKYQNISFPEARRLVKAQTPPDGRSYVYVVDKNHPVYQTTHCPDCNHVVTMSNFPSTSKSPKPVAISSSSGTENRKILPEPISQTCEAGGTSQDSSGFKLVNKRKNTNSSQAQSAINNKIKHNTASKFWKISPNKTLSASGKFTTKILIMQHLPKILTHLLIRVKEIPRTLILTWVSTVLLRSQNIKEQGKITI
ncbi:hypothetical protein AVEN_151173-1 [Araneus ventricosus]|uniref:Uncharacterized protein n=1 Tax=Araneus ventricosus TaxID=182803 RepID=A0A4Y2MS93_ARAVE|nr:hypothetical protein AVEN_151173-1 [Araneus ventricosus]